MLHYLKQTSAVSTPQQRFCVLRALTQRHAWPGDCSKRRIHTPGISHSKPLNEVELITREVLLFFSLG